MNRRTFFHALAGAAAFAVPGLALASSAGKFDFGNVYKGYQLFDMTGDRTGFVIALADDQYHGTPIWDPTPGERRLLQSYVDDYLLDTPDRIKN